MEAFLVGRSSTFPSCLVAASYLVITCLVAALEVALLAVPSYTTAPSLADSLVVTLQAIPSYTTAPSLANSLVVAPIKDTGLAFPCSDLSLAIQDIVAGRDAFALVASSMVASCWADKRGRGSFRLASPAD